LFKTNNQSQHRRLFALAIPMILSNITVPLLGLVDTAVIGHLPHAYYLGGSSVGAMVITVVVWLCGFLRMSTTGLSAQAYGANDSCLSFSILARGLLVAGSIGTIFIILQNYYLDLAMVLAGGSEQVQFYARQYSDIRIWGLPAGLTNLVILGWLLGNHQAKSVMWILIATNLVNLALDLIFVWGFSWQVQGVALATLLAEYIGLVLGLIVIWNKYRVPLLKYRRDVWLALVDKVALKSYFKMNRDIVIRTLCLQICFVFMTFQGARLGDNVVAANAILMNFLLLISFGLDGIANAAEVMVGQAKGARNSHQIKRIVGISLFWTFIFSLVYTAVFYMGGEFFIRSISNIPAVISFANQHLFWVVILPLIACWCYLYDGIYIGLMQFSIMRNSMLIASFVCFFPAWFFFKPLGNHGLWAAFSIFMLVRGITLAWHYHKNQYRMITDEKYRSE
jgi:MATE family multidrug resistance protein